MPNGQQFGRTLYQVGRRHGLLIRPYPSHVLLALPLTITADEIDDLLASLDSTVAETLAFAPPQLPGGLRKAAYGQLFQLEELTGLPKQCFNPPGSPPAIGPYSWATRHDNLVVLAGTAGIDAADGKLVGDDITTQTEDARQPEDSATKSGPPRSASPWRERRACPQGSRLARSD